MESEQREYRWVRLALVSAAIRVSLAVAPALVIVAFGLFVVRALQRAGGRVDVLVWLLLTATFTLGILLAFEAIAGRLRTLGALLDISMEFPYQPPSRISVSMTSPYHVELTTELDGVRRHLRRHQGERDDSGNLSAHLDRVESILTLAAITGTLEPGTRRHSHRVAELAERIGVEIGLDRDRRRWLRWAALLHDVGKLTVPGEVLHKPASLSADEHRIVRTHVTNGARIIRPLIPLLGPWARAVGEHHERWDGKGYPLGLKGDAISLAGRIVAVADTYATMTKGRAYRRRISAAEGLQELEDHAGAQFDPEVVRAFARTWRRRRSPRILLNMPGAAVASLASVWASLGLPAASSAATLGLVGAVAAVAVTAPAVVRILPVAPGSPLSGFEQVLGTASDPAPDQAATEPSPSPSLRPGAATRPAPPAALPARPSPTALLLAPPAITIAPAMSAVEGVALVVDGTVASAGSPARVEVVFGDGSPMQSVKLTGGRFRVAHVYLDEGRAALQVYASGDGGSTNATSAVSITEYPAVVYLPQRATADGGTLSVRGQVIDPSGDAVTAVVDFGDGTGTQALAVNGRDFTVSHTYAAPGSYPVVVTVTDAGGRRTSTQMTVTATAPPAQ